MEKMTETGLKRARRAELLEMMLQQTKEIDRLKNENEQLQQQLSEKTIAIEQAGTLAEASLLVQGVLKDADRAAKQYLENIRQREAQSAAEASKTLLEANVRAEETIKEAKTQAEAIVATAEGEKNRLKKEADDYWQELSTKLENFYREHLGLKELMEFLGKQQAIHKPTIGEAKEK